MNRSSVFHCRTLPLDDRVAELLSWFDGNPKDFPSFVTLYFEEPDKSGHSAGPVSDAVSHRVNNNSNISRMDLVVNSCILSSLLWLLHVYFTLSLPGMASSVPTSSIKLIQSCVKPISLAISPRSSRLRICCKTQIISSFHLCSDLVTAFTHYCRTSKWLTLSSATLPHCSYKLYKQSFVNICFFATAIDMFCSVGHICYLIWLDLLSFSPHNWMAFVRLNKWHFMLCYVISTKLLINEESGYEKGKGHHFEHLLNKNVFFSQSKHPVLFRATNSLPRKA